MSAIITIVEVYDPITTLLVMAGMAVFLLILCLIGTELSCPGDAV
jgi:hypothetical protein